VVAGRSAADVAPEVVGTPVVVSTTPVDEVAEAGIPVVEAGDTAVVALGLTVVVVDAGTQGPRKYTVRLALPGAVAMPLSVAGMPPAE
jgi:hypothetical protein